MAFLVGRVAAWLRLVPVESRPVPLPFLSGRFWAVPKHAALVTLFCGVPLLADLVASLGVVGRAEYNHPPATSLLTRHVVTLIQSLAGLQFWNGLASPREPVSDLWLRAVHSDRPPAMTLEQN